MKKIALFGFLILGMLCKGFSQDYILLGEKRYDATKKWTFGQVSVGFSENAIGVQIAKDGDGGLFILSKRNHIEEIIRGNIIIYLEDGTAIQCVDRGLKDYYNQTSFIIFKLTASEINRLKSIRISAIRFSTYHSYEGLKTFVSNNVLIDSNFFREPEDETSHNTEGAVSKLFGN